MTPCADSSKAIPGGSELGAVAGRAMAASAIEESKETARLRYDD